jgi:hypothetical protein
MEYDITGTIANLVIKGDSGFEQYMEDQEETLHRIKCNDLFYGGLIEMGVEVLFSLFDLEDQEFAQRLPALAHLDRSGRQQFLEQIEHHLENCEHCAIAYQNELELNARIEQVCCANREELLDQLEEGMLAH